MLAQIDLPYQVVVVQHLQQIMIGSLTLGFRERTRALHFSGFKIILLLRNHSHTTTSSLLTTCCANCTDPPFSLIFL